jgi:hypothetical protein
VNAQQRPGPVRGVDDGLGDVGGHGRQVDAHRRERGGVTVDPPHPPGAGLPAGDIQRSTGRVHAGHCEAAVGQQQREHPGPAPDIQHCARAELVGDRRVGIEVAAVRIQRVVDRRQPRVLETRICHRTTLNTSPGPLELIYVHGNC